MLNKTYKLKDGTLMPRIGIGTYHMAEDEKKQEEEIEAIKYALDNGIRLIDTAEMYSDGKAEKLVGKAIQPYSRENLFLVSKILPSNSYGEEFFKSLNSSLERLNTSYLDLYLLHWKGEIPLKETIRCMQEAKKMGLIKNWGVSNFDTTDMEEVYKLDNGECVIDQCLYNLSSRGVEFSLLNNLEKHHVGFMAYCPLAEGGKITSKLVKDKDVLYIANKYHISPYAVLILFTLQKDNVIPIFKSSSKKHMEDNLSGLDLNISKEDFDILDKKYPSPKFKQFLDLR